MRWATLILLAALTGACYSPVVQVRSREPRATPLPGNQAFRISPQPEPAGCQPMGQVVFVTKPRTLRLALKTLRRRVLRMGGNRVVMLRCRPATPDHPRTRFEVPTNLPLKPGQTIHCAGRIYRDPELIR